MKKPLLLAQVRWVKLRIYLQAYNRKNFLIRFYFRPAKNRAAAETLRISDQKVQTTAPFPHTNAGKQSGVS
jgi:hypothetical protein